MVHGSATGAHTRGCHSGSGVKCSYQINFTLAIQIRKLVIQTNLFRELF